MHRRWTLTLAARSRWKPCTRALNSCDPPQTLPSSSSSPIFSPIFATSRMQYASRGRGRRGAPRGRDDDDDDDDEDDDDDTHEFEDVEDTGDYEWDYETWNLLHQGRKEGELSRKWPLPMYKAREMVDYHIMKNRLDGLKVITDPKLEYQIRKQLHEGLVDLHKRTQTALDEIEKQQEKKQLEEKKRLEEKQQLESRDTKEVLQVIAGETKGEDTEEQRSGEEVSLQVDKKDDEGVKAESHAEGEIDKGEAAGLGEDLKDATVTLNAGEEVFQQENVDLSTIATAVDEIINDVLSVPEVTTLELGKDTAVEVKTEEAAEDDGINVFDYDKWVAYKEQEWAKRYAAEEERKHATLRWKIQLVLGPGDVVHPANRKASVSVYVRELCLSKYAKQRLLALVGRRYKAPKDELTIVSERYPHRYENQKDVLRTLLALIEEAKKADQLVNDARIAYLKTKKAELKGAEISVAAM